MLTVRKLRAASRAARGIVRDVRRGTRSHMCCDKQGAELGILLQEQRDKGAAKRVFKRVLRLSPVSLACYRFAPSSST